MTTDSTGRERLLMDPGWRFQLGDLGPTVVINHGDTYTAVKAGHAGGPAGKVFDDKDWRALDLPHDFILEQPYDPTANVSHGFRRGAVGWYRKCFDLPAEDLGRRLRLEFDGVFRNCTVWLNGFLLGTHASGYTSFHYDITEVAHYGGRNVLAVRVDATDLEGWWYEGGGVYRHVWLTKTPPLHVDHWGVFVAPALNEDFSRAEIAIETTVVNDGEAEATAQLTSTILDPEGAVVGKAVAEQTLGPGETAALRQTVTVAAPQLWDLGSPVLYTLRTALSSGDHVETPFGIRHIRFDAEAGFFLNGRPVKLLGTCNHQDHAGVGLAVPEAVQAFRIKRLQAMGSNAYRCAHNPPAPELLDACDRLGMLVMDENRHLSCAPWGLADLESMIRRDRNHPSIIMWSMANEELIQGSEVGTRIARRVIQRTKELDPTRPTITAICANWGGDFALAHDLMGANYRLAEYDQYHADYPQHPMVGSETSAALGTRGEYVTDAAKGYMSAYDLNPPGFGATAEAAWQAIAERPWIAGTFVWTGFDYRGEPQPYEWPCISSHFGLMDTCGFPKDNFYYYAARWRQDTVLHVLPHWNWPDRVGETIPVWVHSNCDEVELLLNGESLGRQTLPRNGHLEWQVTYAPGTLVAKGFVGGEEVGTATVETTGPPHHLRLIPDRETLAADGEDVCLLAALVCDEHGRVVPVADSRLTFAVSDNARLLGVGNGDPSDHDPDQANCRRAFHGLCQALVQTRREAAGAITVTATAPGLLPATLALTAEAATVRPFV